MHVSHDHNGHRVSVQDKSRDPAPILSVNPTDLVRVESEKQGEEMIKDLMVPKIISLKPVGESSE